MCEEIIEIDANTFLNKEEKLSGIDSGKGNHESRPHCDENSEPF